MFIKGVLGLYFVVGGILLIRNSNFSDPFHCPFININLMPNIAQFKIQIIVWSNPSLKMTYWLRSREVDTTANHILCELKSRSDNISLKNRNHNARENNQLWKQSLLKTCPRWALGLQQSRVSRVVFHFSGLKVCKVKFWLARRQIKKTHILKTSIFPYPIGLCGGEYS